MAWLRGSPRGFAMRIELSGAALAASLLLASPAVAADSTAMQGAIRLAQADDQPMVITPHPQNGQQLPPPSDPGGPGVPYEPTPGGATPPPGGEAYVPPPGGQAYAPPEAKSPQDNTTRTGSEHGQASSFCLRDSISFTAYARPLERGKHTSEVDTEQAASGAHHFASVDWHTITGHENSRSSRRRGLRSVRGGARSEEQGPRGQEKREGGKEPALPSQRLHRSEDRQ